MAGTATWLGHATWLIESAAGTRILVDPFLEQNPSCPAEFHSVSDIDLILVTHGHVDHNADVKAVADRCKAPVAGMVELMGFFDGLGVANTTGFNKGGTVRFGGVVVTMTNAFHSSSAEGADGQTIYTGEPAGFVITLEDGFRIYIAGDTCVFGDMKIIGELYRPDLAILPIGGYYTMDPLEAGYATGLLDVKHVLGSHYGTFPVLEGTPSELRKHVSSGVTVHELAPGQSMALPSTVGAH